MTTPPRDERSTWDHVKQAYTWTGNVVPGWTQRRLKARWQVIGKEWKGSANVRDTVAVRVVALALGVVTALLWIPLLLILVLVMPWRVVATKRSQGATLVALAITWSVLVVVLLALLPTSSGRPTSGPTPQTCDIRRMASGGGGYESFSIPAGSPGFDLRFETTGGALTVRPDFEQMGCTAEAMRELAAAGFYRGHVCDQLTYAQLDCYTSEPKNRDYGFRVSSRDVSAPRLETHTREGTVLLTVDAQDGWVTGLLSSSAPLTRPRLGPNASHRSGRSSTASTS